MKPTFLKVGIPLNKVRPPTTVRPPTSTTQPSATNVVTQKDTSAGPITVTMPTASNGDRLYLFAQGFNSGVTITSAPTGFTLIGSGNPDNYGYLYYLDVSGTAPVSVDFTPSSNSQWRTTTVTISNAASTTHTASSFYEGFATNVNNPPAVTPSTGAGDYLVLTFTGHIEDQGGAEPDGSTGYDTVSWSAGASPHVFVQKANVAITTSEDPDSWNYPDDGFGNLIVSVTVAIPYGTPDVAPGNHTHTESDVTDLDHTDTNAIHDNVASEISALTEVTPVSGDWLLIEDASDSNNKKKIDFGNITGVSDHGGLTGLSDDDHSQYTLADGTRAFTGAQSMGSNKLTNVTDPTSAQDAATKAYVDANAGTSADDTYIWRPTLDDDGAIVVDDDGAAVMGYGPA